MDVFISKGDSPTKVGIAGAQKKTSPSKSKTTFKKAGLQK
jgi:hypothetical protein